MASYDFSLTTFEKTGKLAGVDHALAAVAKGQMSLGIQASNGVVLASEKMVPSSLVETDSLAKVEALSDSAGVTYAGLNADFRLLVKNGQKQAQTYFRKYREGMPSLQLVRKLADVMQEYTQSGGVRPFGVSLLAAGYDDEDGAQLFQIDPSGTQFGWKASAIGRNFKQAKSFLEKRWSEDLELEDAIHMALLTLREGFEGEMTSDKIEVAVCDKEGFRVLSASDVDDYLEEAE